MLSGTYYSQNYASIIRPTLSWSRSQMQKNVLWNRLGRVAVLTRLSSVQGEPEYKTALVFRELEWNSVVKARLGSMAGLRLGAEVGQSRHAVTVTKIG